MDKTARGWINILKLIVPYFIIVGTFQVIAKLLLGLDFEQEPENMTGYQHLVISVFGLIGTLLLLLFFMKNVDKTKFIELGFQHKGKMKEVYWGITITAGVMLFSFVVLLLLNQIQFVQVNFLPVEFLYSLGLFIIVAVVEEVLFRGYILGNLLH